MKPFLLMCIVFSALVIFATMANSSPTSGSKAEGNVSSDFLELLVRRKRDVDAYENCAEICAWLKEKTGWGCDGPLERWMYKLYIRLRYGATDCNSVCIKRDKRRGGSCVPGASDNSTWCNSGYRCNCFD